jgi:hypothetical protein
MSKNRIEEFNWCIVGGPYHGTKISESHGYKPVSMMRKSFGFGSNQYLEHVPLRFVVGENESVVTVFSLPDMLPVAAQHFLNGDFDDEKMRNYDLWQDQVYPSIKISIYGV